MYLISVILWGRERLTVSGHLLVKKKSANLFHSSLPLITCVVRLWLCYIFIAGYIFLYHWCFETQRSTLPKLSIRRVVFWIFFDSWRRFCVVPRIKGRIEEPDIKKNNEGIGCWKAKKRDSEDRNSRNLNHWVWMIQGHLHSLPISSN